MRLAVDALNLVADRRGMGRYTRAILRDFGNRTDLATTLLVRDAAHVALLRAEFGFDVQTLHAARSRHFDAVWYPWNGVRFEPRARKLVTIHDAFAFTDPAHGIVARWREQAPIRRALRVADRLATVSHWSASELARVSGIDADRFAIVSPVPEAFWQPVPIEREPRPYMLFVAGPDHRKNAGLLFAAFERAFPDGDVMLVVAGTLRDADEAALRASNIVHERVRPNDQALRELYSGAYAVAIPSLAEGYGLMAVEAMACGAAVIAADAAALPQTCEGAAMLVAPRDVDGWSAALRNVAEDDTLRADLQRRSLERAARIDRHAPARLTLELLESIAPTPSP
ncbi:MAG: glycosyltransferase family 4 protein [Vulcanimicrobiaceae bacterium]